VVNGVGVQKLAPPRQYEIAGYFEHNARTRGRALKL
jgi:hypothetical protein